MPKRIGKKNLEIVQVAKSNPGMKQEDALKEAENRGLRLLTNKEIDSILQNDSLREQYKDFFPVWTGTKIELNGKKAKITENGKVIEKEVSEEDGWFEQDEFGMPFGNSSSSSNKDARYLWRLSNSIFVLFCRLF